MLIVYRDIRHTRRTRQKYVSCLLNQLLNGIGKGNALVGRKRRLTIVVESVYTVDTPRNEMTMHSSKSAVI